jgi:hypothetical protein
MILTPEDREMLDLRAKTQAWIDDLLIAGMSQNAASAAIHQALVERSLVTGGVAATAHWLRAMAKHTEIHGPALLAELRKQGH